MNNTEVQLTSVFRVPLAPGQTQRLIPDLERAVASILAKHAEVVFVDAFPTSAEVRAQLRQEATA